jgi:NADPH:quinone reductase-like Zn-dependent oxidoreductase
MRSLQIPKFGPPEVLRIVTGPDPEPGPGEVLVEVEYSGVNFSDIMARMGLYPDAGRPPIVPGYEFAGSVRAVGAGVTELSAGDPVAGLRNFGGHADLLVARSENVLRRPSGVDAVLGAAFPVVYLTAWHALVRMGNLQAGERILIHNAGGGLGTAAVQIAGHVGAVVWGTASPSKHDLLRGLGVTEVFDYPDWPARVRELTGGSGVEFILDPIGGRNLARGFESLAHTGRIVACGTSGFAPGLKRRPLHLVLELLRWPRFNALRMIVKNRGVFGVHLGHLWHRPDLLREEMGEILDLLDKRVLDPVIDRIIPAGEAASAHRRLQEHHNRGKIVLAW